MSPLAIRRPALAGFPTRVEFDLETFRQGIADHGYSVSWSKAMLCPNKDPNQDDHHRINCTICDENGFIYFDIQSPVLMEITSLNTAQKYMPESRFEPGTIYITAPPELELSFWDKLELLDSQARFSEVQKLVATKLTYKLKYTILTDDDSSIIQVVGAPSGSVIVDTTYSVVNGELVFSTLPVGDAFFSVAYLYHPAYIVLDLIHHTRDSRVTEGGADVAKRFPVQALARLDFLVRDESED